MPGNLHFDPESHRYQIDGRQVPSVTQVLEPLNELDGIPPDILEAARIRGQHVHRAIHLDLHKTLDWRTLDPVLVPYVTAARKFIRELEVRVLVNEYHLYDAQLMFAGTLDVIGLIEKLTWVIDWKAASAMPRTTGPQTAAYDYLYRKTYGERGGRPYKRMGVLLTDEAKYSVHRFDDPRDWQWFVSALNIWHWRNAA